MLSCSVPVSERLLAQVEQILGASPALARKAGVHGARQLVASLPPGWEPSAVRDAKTVRMTMSASGHLYDIAEVSASGGVSGGTIGSCMSQTAVEKFLRHWCATAQQGELWS